MLRFRLEPGQTLPETVLHLICGSDFGTNLARPAITRRLLDAQRGGGASMGGPRSRLEYMALSAKIYSALGRKSCTQIRA